MSSGSGETVVVKEIKESPPGSPEDSRKVIKKKSSVIKAEEKDLKP